MLKFTPAIALIFLVLAVFGYLMLSRQLTSDWLLFLVLIIVGLLLWNKSSPGNINLKDVVRLTISVAEEFQRDNKLPHGELYIGDVRLRERMLLSEHGKGDEKRTFQDIVPHKWESVLLIEGTTVHGFLFEFDRKGVFMKKVEIPAPKLFSLLEDMPLERFGGREVDKMMEPEERG